MLDRCEARHRRARPALRPGARRLRRRGPYVPMTNWSTLRVRGRRRSLPSPAPGAARHTELIVVERDLANGFIHGMSLLPEAIRQIRGESPNQVPSARLSLVTGGPMDSVVSSSEDTLSAPSTPVQV